MQIKERLERASNALEGHLRGQTNTIAGLLPFALTLGVLAIVLGVFALISTNIETNTTINPGALNNSLAYNITHQGPVALNTIAANINLIALVGVFAFIIVFLVGSFMFLMGGQGVGRR